MKSVLEGLKSINFYEIKGEGYILTYTRTDFTDALHEAFGFRTDYQILNKSQMKKILKIQKSKKSTHFLNTALKLESLCLKWTSSFFCFSTVKDEIIIQKKTSLNVLYRGLFCYFSNLGLAEQILINNLRRYLV